MNILSLIEKGLEIVWLVIGPIILIWATYILVKLIYFYQKYGYLEFDLVEKRPITKFSDLILMMLDKVKGYKKIYKPDNLYTDIIIIDKTGLYLLKLIKFQGVIVGDRKETILTNQINLNETIEIDNPFYLLDLDRQKLLEINPNLAIKIGLVTSNTVNIKVNKVSKEEVFFLKDFYFKMENHLKQTRIYKNKEIKDLYKKIKNYKYE